MDGWEVHFSLYIIIIFAKEIILTTLPGWIVQTSYLQQAAQNKKNHKTSGSDQYFFNIGERNLSITGGVCDGVGRSIFC